jgi:hypothetical protein
MKFILRTGVASLVLLLLEAARHLSWQEVASALLVCAILCWMTERSRASGVELVVALAGFYFILVSLTTIPEGVLFDVIKVGLAPLMMARELGIALVLAMAIAALFQRFRGVSRTTPEAGFGMTIAGLLWRLAAAVMVFMVCYLAAGMLIYPLVKSYYQGRNMPVPGAMVAMIILKVVCLVIAAWLVLRRIPNRRDARLILATAFPVIGVFSLMLHHNELMPPAVRWVHTMEMTPYYALCGFLFAIWFGPARASESPQESSESRR